MAHYTISPSEEADLLKFMHRWDLYQWADKTGIEYPKDAPAVVMKTLIRANGSLPTPAEFDPLHNERGEVYSYRYKRLSPLEAPRSRHADAEEAETAKRLAKRRAELESMNDRQLTREVKNQYGSKILDRDLSREDKIALFVGEAADTATALTEQIAEIYPDSANTSPPAEAIPENILAMLTPMQLVKLCKQRGIEAKIKDGKAVLLEKLRSAA